MGVDTVFAKFVWSILEDEKTETAIAPFLTTLLIALSNETLTQFLAPKVCLSFPLRVAAYVGLFLGMALLAVKKKKRINQTAETSAKSKELDALGKSLSEISELREKENGCTHHIRWKNKTRKIIKRLFGEDSDELKEFKNIHYYPIGQISTIKPNFSAWYLKGLDDAELLIKDLIEEQKS